ncbi:MAG: histidinol-phosphatase [Actinobacteria bacterium]|nr:histidinol-phosphatase [Actinomycetota bacterium]
MSDLDAFLSFAHELADRADDLTLPAFRHGMEVRTKRDGSPVTDADVGTERALRDAIAARYPGHAVLGEEHGRIGPDGAPTWIVDPIDGTNNFIVGIPVFATLIALAIDDEPVVGVVSAPALASRWDGIAGGGAHHNGARIEVSDIRDLAEGQVSVGGFTYFRREGYGAFLDHLHEHTRRQRGFGDFWQHCLVASGSIEAAVEAAVSLWDLAAVKVIVEAAGGRFTDVHGDATAAGGSGVSSNGHVHDRVLELLGANTAR